jgi:STE24 endopeptidase
VSLIAPVYISPLFNKYKTLEDSRIRDPILSMARANGIPATNVYEFDASEQSNRVSANVSGFATTLRISLNDNLLKRCTLPEIETTMGHEMGHYVLNHEYKGLVMIGVVIVIGFAFLNWGVNYSLARWGGAWGVRDITDIAVLPLAAIVFSFFFFVTTPVTNTITRTMEFEADMYGLNAARQPDGEANVDLLLGEYRKLDPSPIEEFVFFDHPSGRTRITAAMQWKAEHPETTSAEEMARRVFHAE